MSTSASSLGGNFKTRQPAFKELAQWCSTGWRLFRAAPIRYFGLAAFPIVVEALVQAIPTAGVLLSKLLTPLAATYALALLDRQARTARLGWRDAARRWRARFPVMAGLTLVFFGLFALQIAVAGTIAGSEQAIALATGDMAALHLSRFELFAVLTSGLPIAFLLMFAAPRALLDGRAVVQSLRESTVAALCHWQATALLLLISAALIGGMLFNPLWLIMFVPFSTMVGYAAYRHVFDRSGAKNAHARSGY